VPQDNVWGTLKYCNASLALLDADTTPSTRGKMFLASFCLRWLVHVVGDVHQPLHTTQRFSDQFPTGDQGGNLCLINRTERNLHALWDQGGGVYSRLDFDHPPTAAQFALIHKQAADLRAAWPRAHFPNSTVDVNNFRQWINESYALAVAVAYQNGSLRLQRLAAARRRVLAGGRRHQRRADGARRLPPRRARDRVCAAHLR
jgi:hypothetical protein